MSTAVKYFDSTMSGAPTLSNVAGSLIDVLDACLVNGFGSVTLDSLVIADNVATGTISTGHNLAMIGNTGPVIRIEGATPGGLNADWRIASVPSSTQFTAATTGIGNQTATGTITAKRAPAGFSKAFTGTNKAVYQSDDIQGCRLFCRIDDSIGGNARIRGYETMSDVDTGTGLFPTDAQMSGGGYVYKANAASRTWMLFSDGQMVYFFCDATGTNWVGGFTFGDIVSGLSPDAYAVAMIASITSTGNHNLALINSTTGSWLARRYTQSGTSYAAARYSHLKNTSLGIGGESYPGVVNNALRLWPVESWESTTNFRGMIPGLYNPVHNNTIPQATIINNIPALPGRTLIIQNTASAQAAMDLTGPWR